MSILKRQSVEATDHEKWTEDYKRGFLGHKVKEMENRYFLEVHCSEVGCKWIRPGYNRDKLVFDNQGKCGHHFLMIGHSYVQSGLQGHSKWRSPRIPVCMNYAPAETKPDWVSEEAWAQSMKGREHYTIEGSRASMY